MNLRLIVPILVLMSILIVAGCTKSESTSNSDIVVKKEYVCPDGSTVSDPTNCPKPKLEEKLLFNPLSFNFYVQPGEELSKELKITNNNPTAVWVGCPEIGLNSDVSEFEPYIYCSRWSDNGLDKVSKAKLNPGESRSFTLAVTTMKDVTYTNAEQETYKVTTRSGEYSREIPFYIKNNGDIYYNADSVKKVPLKIVVS